MRFGISTSYLLTDEFARLTTQRRIRHGLNNWGVFTTSLVLNDVIMAILAFLSAYFLRFFISLPIFDQQGEASPQIYGTLLILKLPILLLIYKMTGLYNRQNLLGGMREFNLIFNSTVLLMFTIILVGFLKPTFIFARAWLLMDWIYTALFTIIGRFGIRKIIHLLREKGYYLSPALIVGTNDEAKMLAEQFTNWRSCGLLVEGFISNRTEDQSASVLPIVGSIDNLDEVINQFKIEEIILATSALNREEILAIFMRYGFSNEVNLRMSSGIYEMITTQLSIREVAYVPLVSVNKVRLTGFDWALKTLLDYMITIPLLIPGSLVFIAIAIAIKIDSPGPIFYRRRVKGLNNRDFDALKFRTMYVNGDQILQSKPELMEELAKNHKLKDDPRITRVGKFLRKYSLDELPQLLNVAAGQMSLVGPRMISPSEVEKYNKWGMNLMTVKPGITGLWQVSGRSDISYDQRVNLDMTYIRNWNIWLDFYLLYRTIPAVLSGRGAY